MIDDQAANISADIYFSFFAGSDGQTSDEDAPVAVSAPEGAMREVIRRILIYQFKPASRRKVIYLAQKGIEQSWLPSIPNVEFRLLSEEEIEDSTARLYFFTDLKRSGNTYEIGFAFGDPHCDYSGMSWEFRVVGKHLKLWRDRGRGFGAGCGGGTGSGSSTEFDSPGQINTYPNELKKFRFFDQGKLKNLKLTISNRADVKNNFGADCESICDYDQNWKINFIYFNDFHREITINDKQIKIVSKKEYEGKLYSIALMPKSEILFDKVIFPPNFRQKTVYTAAHDGMGGGTNSSHNVYFDRYGLKYSLLEKVSLTTIKDLQWKKGELTSIEYTIPNKLEEGFFVRQEQ